MKMLFLDDNVQRIKLIKEFISVFNKDIELHTCNTVDEAFYFIDKEKYDIASLDHDLDGLIYAESNSTSGYAVVQHICGLRRIKQPNVVVVHSVNTIGSTKMLNKLQKHGIVSICAPFHSPEYFKDLSCLLKKKSVYL